MSIKRGTPAAQLKAAFPFLEIAVVVNPRTQTDSYDPLNPAHAADVLVIITWFMLREKEVASARVRDLTLTLTRHPSQVQLSIPLHKTATGGGDQLTQRKLKCACGTSTRPLCPTCAAQRHLRRLHQADLGSPDGPLFPDAHGETPSREFNLHLIRRVLTFAGIPTEYDDGMGHHKPIYGGHAARVAGAYFMAAQGVPMAVIQVLGRWSSSAIERYVQAAPMTLAPQVPAMALTGRAGQLGTPTAPETQDYRLLTCTEPDEDPISQFGDPPTGTQTKEPELIRDMRPEEAQRVTDGMEDQYISHARTGKAHRTDPAEGKVDQTLWKAPCGWRYGGYRYYRHEGIPPAHNRCRRCWRDPTDPVRVEEEDNVSVESSSDSTDSSSSESTS